MPAGLIHTKLIPICLVMSLKKTMSVRKLLDNQLEKLLKIVWITISKWKVLLMHILLKESVLYKNLHVI